MFDPKYIIKELKLKARRSSDINKDANKPKVLNIGEHQNTVSY
jgi:hypothetical protein